MTILQIELPYTPTMYSDDPEATVGVMTPPRGIKVSVGMSHSTATHRLIIRVVVSFFPRSLLPFFPPAFLPAIHGAAIRI